MTNLLPPGALAMAGAPIASIIVIVGTPLVMTAATILLGLLAVFCVGIANERRRARPPTAPAHATTPDAAMPYAATGGERR